MADLEHGEAALAQEQDRKRQTQQLADRAFGLVRDFDRLVEMGTVDEKRSLVRAFLRGIDYDPESASGMAQFWMVPGVSGDGDDSNPGGRGRRTDVAQNCSHEDPADDAAGPRLLFPLGSGGTRFTKKRSAANDDASSFHMVSGACCQTFSKILATAAVRTLIHTAGARGRRPCGILPA
jgi:hypothetical protein